MAYLPELHEWLAFKKSLEALGFRALTADELSPSARGYGLVRPSSRRYQESGEALFVYEPPAALASLSGKRNTYKVIVCTTKLSRGGWVSRDFGWIIWVDGETAARPRTSYPFRRTATFLERLLLRARIERWRVFYRPVCCGKYMDATHRKGALKSMYWKCAVRPHDRTHDKRWEEIRKPLPPEAVAVVERERRMRKNRRKHVREEGGNPFTTFEQRMQHPWRAVPREASINF